VVVIVVPTVLTVIAIAVAVLSHSAKRRSLVKEIASKQQAEISRSGILKKEKKKRKEKKRNEMKKTPTQSSLDGRDRGRSVFPLRQAKELGEGNRFETG
jgi:hypothetical protein